MQWLAYKGGFCLGGQVDASTVAFLACPSAAARSIPADVAAEDALALHGCLQLHVEEGLVRSWPCYWLALPVCNPWIAHAGTLQYNLYHMSHHRGGARPWVLDCHCHAYYTTGAG